MATVELKEVLIWYAVTPKGVETRIRTYVDGDAIKEHSLPEPVSEDVLTSLAKQAGRQAWTEEDICAHLGKGTTWAKGEALALDIYTKAELGLKDAAPEAQPVVEDKAP